MNKHLLLVENQRIEYLLENIVQSLTSNETLRQDLMQEARIHLWRLQSERPGQTVSWYLRGCRFRLQHFLATGRSVDSNKRGASQLPLFEEDRDTLECFEQLRAESHTFDEACVSDLIATLSMALNPGEMEVLHCLADGLPTSLIAKRLNLSSPTVTRVPAQNCPADGEDRCCRSHDGARSVALAGVPAAGQQQAANWAGTHAELTRSERSFPKLPDTRFRIR